MIAEEERVEKKLELTIFLHLDGKSPKTFSFVRLKI